MSRISQTDEFHELTPVGGVPVEGAVQVEDLGNGDPVGELTLLELHPEHLVDLVLVCARVEPQDLHGAHVRVTQPGDALDGRGLTGTVGTDDPEDLAGRHGQGDVVDGRVRLSPVALEEMSDLHSGCCRGRSVLRHAYDATKQTPLRTSANQLGCG